MLVDFKPRLYQETIFASTSPKNSLVVLPTGLGKTAIALMMAAHRMQMYPDMKIVMLAPTKPLVEQHMQYFMEHLRNHDDDFVLFTGAVAPEKRAQMFKDATFIFSTPQGLENDIISSRIDISQASLVIFDEAHRATGDYSYVFIADRYMKLARFPRILALTASPGSEKEKIDEICKNLCIENIEVRTHDDADVKPYVQETAVLWKEVNLPAPLMKIKTVLDVMFKRKLEKTKELGYVKNTFGLSRRQLLALMGGLQRELMDGEKTMELMMTISILSEVLKVSHAQELLETQGVGALFSYIRKIMSQAGSTKTKSIKNLVADPDFRSVFLLTKELVEKGVEHPKIGEIRNIVEANRTKKKIIFTQYRDSGKMIVDEIENIDGVSAKLFVGQTKKSGSGMSQKQQLAVIKEFREGAFDTLVMTSVGEEGLDIPQVDLVVFYEPIPSAIRTIQRRGRTGRMEKGSVIVLYSKGTRDEMYRWAAFHKEKRMLKLMKEMKTEREIKQEKSLYDFEEKEEYGIVVDYREKNSLIVKDLINKGYKIDLKKLDVGDYLLSSRVAVEYKRVVDFVDSVIDGRLLHQLKSLKSYYFRPLVVVEGTEDLYSVRKIDPKALQGMLATITVSYGIPILYTKNSKETASLFSVITKREQDEGFKEFTMHAAKPLTLKEQQEYLISALPGIGPKLAKPLLEKFGSPGKVLSASVDELKEVELIGKKKAVKVRELIESEYEREE